MTDAEKWECDYCNKEFHKKDDCIKHEQKCTNRLVSCKDCNKKISRNADACPNCGSRTKNTEITKGINRPLKPALGASSAILFGPFAYLYVRRTDLCLTWLVVGVLLAAFTLGIAVPFLWAGWATHIYSIATKINKELGYSADGKEKIK